MQTIGVFFGSRSPEHDVSIITGQLIISELKKMGHQVLPVYIGQDGRWYIANDLGRLQFFTVNNFSAELETHGFQNYFLDLPKSQGKLVFRTKGWRGREVVIDLAIPALHGQFGEDGTIQGLFEMFNVPYVGCGVAASAIAMDKSLTKDLYRAHSIPTTPSVTFSASDWANNKSTILKNIRAARKTVVFVKPARLGSSIGIGKVHDASAEDLEFKIEVALHYDNKVIVEDAVENVADLTCAVLGTNNPRVSVIQESIFENDLFDFSEKYLQDGGAQLGNAKRGLIIPANIPREVAIAIQETSKRIFAAVGCSGIARVDWLYNKTTGEYFANEINTMPGTLYHHLWKASGVSLSEIITELIRAAREVQEEKNKLTHVFTSKLLEQTGSLKLPGSKLA